MPDHQRYTLFSGTNKLGEGDLQSVALAARQALAADGAAVLIFSDTSGRPVDLDLRGSSTDVLERYADTDAAPVKPGRGRPKLGVVAREVTLLPRHWEWLGSQPGGASAALRRLVDQARRDSAGPGRRREAQEAAHRVMTTLAGNLANYEEALRAFYAGERDRFHDLIAAWPTDVATYVRLHADAVWTD